MKKQQTEAESRKNLLNTAAKLGCQHEVQQILNKYDKLLKNCTNQNEYKQIAILGLVELHKFLGCSGSLVVNGQEILPATN